MSPQNGRVDKTQDKVKMNMAANGTGGTRWRSWLRHCATNRKVAGSIPDGVTGIFHRLNPSGRTMALGSTLLLNRNEYQELPCGVIALG
jgi:hypothetical protein